MNNHKKSFFSISELVRLLKTMSLLYVILVALSIGFAMLVDEVLEHDTQSFDVMVLKYVRGFASPNLDKLFVVVTQFAGPIIVGLIFLILFGYTWTRYYRYYSLFLCLTIPRTVLLNSILKLLFRRDRPNLWEKIVTEKSFSFPSGHAMISMAIALSLVFILNRSRYRKWGIPIAIVYVLLIALSRLYLGVYYPTDILGGWLMSAAWFSVVVLTMKHKGYLNAQS